MEECDVCILLVDATLGMESQDVNIFALAQKRQKGIVILINKWDLINKETNTSRDLEKEIRERIAPFTDVPILFISATEKVRIFQGLEAALSVYENRTRKIKTSELNDTLLPIIENMPPPAHRGKYIKIKYITQLPTRNPSFVFFCNHPAHIKDHYRNFLENQMRKHFNFTGVPIHILFRQK
jgi:GTP-binding protein